MCSVTPLGAGRRPATVSAAAAAASIPSAGAAVIAPARDIAPPPPPPPTPGRWRLERLVARPQQGVSSSMKARGSWDHLLWLWLWLWLAPGARTARAR